MSDLANQSEPLRMYLHEPGWRIRLKVGSEREFCYQMAPGESYYHRFYDGEIYLFHAEDKICMACAQRRGLISYKPKPLKEVVFAEAVIAGDDVEELELAEYREPEPVEAYLREFEGYALVDEDDVPASESDVYKREKRDAEPSNGRGHAKPFDPFDPATWN